jgi:hypothetical protein
MVAALPTLLHPPGESDGFIIKYIEWDANSKGDVSKSKTGLSVDSQAGRQGGLDGLDGRPISLEEFTTRLEEMGFQPGKRNPAAYRHPDTPELRFVIRKKVVRLEEIEQGKGGLWLLNSPYLISRQLSFALWAAENRKADRSTDLKRRTVVSRGVILFFSALGVIAILLFLLIFYGRREDYLFGWDDLIIWVIFLGGGLAIEAFALIWWTAREAFERSARQVTARVVNRRREAKSDPDGPDYVLSFYLTLSFIPSAAVSVGQRVKFEAQVNEEIYEAFQTGFPIEVRYAGENPQIAILEGE